MRYVLPAVPEPAVTAPGPHRRRRPTRTQRRARLVLVLVAIAALVVILVVALRGHSVPKPPAPGVATEPNSTDPFSYASSRASDFAARATAGNAHVLFTKSPGGAFATAVRVARYRPAIDRAVKGTGIDPALLEGLVFVESAGRPDAIAGSDPAGASGLTQILASTGPLLGMHINLARSRQLTRRIDAVASGARRGNLRRLEAQRRAADQRFDPRQALSATVRYLRNAEHQFGREDLAFESYHMGIGNMRTVLADYDGGRPVPYVQLYFDSAPDRHGAAFRLLSSFGDDSALYWWRILGALQIMRLYRSDRAALSRLSALQESDAAGAAVLHPPGRPPRYPNPSALARGYQTRELVPLPRNAEQLGLAYDTSMGAGAKAVKAPPALYRGLRPDALRMLIELAGRVRALSGGAQPLRVSATVADARYQSQRGIYDPSATTGFAFAIDRRYVRPTQAQAFQWLLDRLESLNLVAWARDGSVLRITVASGATSWRG